MKNLEEEEEEEEMEGGVINDPCQIRVIISDEQKQEM